MLLNALITASFADSFVVSNANAWHHILECTKEVQDLRQGLSTGAVTEGALNDFVSGLLEDFKPGELFVHEPALAAIAVALQGSALGYATEYLTGLANLRKAEIPLATRVARIVLEQQNSR